jgi:hypothetical protein
MKAILQWVLRTMMKDQTGIVQTMPKKDIVDFNVAMTMERLMRNGVNPNSLKNANQVENALNMIDNRPKVQEGITSTKSAKVFDLEGKEIDPKKGIMGGKRIPDDDLPPPGSRGGPDDIAAPTQSADESLRDMMEAEIKKRLETGNKKSIARIRNKKMVKDAIDNMSPGFVKGDRKYNAQLVAEDLAEKKFGKDFYDLDQKLQNDLYGEALDGLSVDLEDFATGGRAGFKLGSIDKARRAFLKTVGAAGAGITALKTGLLGLGKEAAPIVDKAVETVTEAPSYFFDLVAKIKLFGKQRTTPSYKERVNEFTYTGKNGDQYELIEDLDTGEIMIQKDKMGMGVSGDKSFDVISDRTEMRYKKPKPDEGDPNPSEEYEEYKVEFDQDGTAADASQIDEISKKEIIEEVTEDAPSIKKAGGGIAGMLGE